MIALTHFDTASTDFVARARAALEALAERPGYRRGTIGRSTDDLDAWVLLTEWDDVGSYRRALGNYAVKVHATPLLAEARDLPGGFEALVDIDPGGATMVHDSDREPDA